MALTTLLCLFPRWHPPFRQRPLQFADFLDVLRLLNSVPNLCLLLGRHESTLAYITLSAGLG